MAGWISVIMAATILGIAVSHPEKGSFAGQALGGNVFAMPAILLFLTLLSYFVAYKSPRWSSSRQAGEWASAFAALAIVLMNMHLLPAYLVQADPAAPARPDKAMEKPQQEKGAEKQRKPRRTHHAVRRPDSPPQAPPEPDIRGLDLPPGSPHKVLVRDADGNEYFYPLNPGEKLPSDLTDLDALAKGAWTEIKGNARGHFIVTARINNQPVKVLVDTGASAVALSHEDARRAGIHTFALKYTVPVSTANGVVKAAPVTLRRVEVDGVLVRNVRAWVMPRGAMRGTLLGMSFLSRLSMFKVDHGKLVLKQ